MCHPMSSSEGVTGVTCRPVLPQAETYTRPAGRRRQYGFQPLEETTSFSSPESYSSTAPLLAPRPRQKRPVVQQQQQQQHPERHEPTYEDIHEAFGVYEPRAAHHQHHRRRHRALRSHRVKLFVCLCACVCACTEGTHTPARGGCTRRSRGAESLWEMSGCHATDVVVVALKI